MQEAGKKFRYLVQFLSGQPTSDFTYTLYSQDGSVVLTETLPTTTGQLSYTIEIPAGSNALSQPLYEQMTLEWEYTTADQAITDSVTYTIHAPIGFPVSAEAVRRLIGVDDEELPDSDIDLFDGFMAFRQYVGETADLTSYVNTGSPENYRITKAIEAVTAIKLLPTLQIRLPRKYDSGTSSYERWNNLDWAGLAAELQLHLDAAFLIINPDDDIYPFVDIFGLSDRGVDPITGA